MDHSVCFNAGWVHYKFGFAKPAHILRSVFASWTDSFDYNDKNECKMCFSNNTKIPIDMKDCAHFWFWVKYRVIRYVHRRWNCVDGAKEDTETSKICMKIIAKFDFKKWKKLSTMRQTEEERERERQRTTCTQMTDKSWQCCQNLAAIILLLLLLCCAMFLF